MTAALNAKFLNDSGGLIIFDVMHLNGYLNPRLVD